MRQTPYRNVSWHARKRKWKVAFHLRSFSQGKTLHLGYYQDDKEAARVGDVARLILHKAGKLDGRVDPTPELDGQPPPTVSLAEILDRMFSQQVISPAEAAKILALQNNKSA